MPEETSVHAAHQRENRLWIAVGHFVREVLRDVRHDDDQELGGGCGVRTVDVFPSVEDVLDRGDGFAIVSVGTGGRLSVEPVELGRQRAHQRWVLLVENDQLAQEVIECVQRIAARICEPLEVSRHEFVHLGVVSRDEFVEDGVLVAKVLVERSNGNARDPSYVRRRRAHVAPLDEETTSGDEDCFYRLPRAFLRRGATGARNLRGSPLLAGGERRSSAFLARSGSAGNASVASSHEWTL